MNQFNNLFDQLTEDFVNTKKIIEEFFPNEQSEYLQDLSETMKVLTETDLRFKAEEKAAEQIRETLKQAPVEDVEKFYNETVKPIGTNDYKSHDNWCAVFNVSEREVQEVVEEQQEVVYEKLNSSLSCSVATFKPPVDCISKTIIRDPYRNKKCKHVYEKRLIFEYVKKMKNKARCPFVGCVNYNLRGEDLFPDNELRQKIDDYLKENVQEEEDDDSE